MVTPTFRELTNEMKDCYLYGVLTSSHHEESYHIMLLLHNIARLAS